MAANFSVHCEIEVTGERPGRPIAGSGEVSIVTSDISTKSRSRIFFATLGASEAAGLNEPGLVRPSSQTWGVPQDGPLRKRMLLLRAGPGQCVTLLLG